MMPPPMRSSEPTVPLTTGRVRRSRPADEYSLRLPSGLWHPVPLGHVKMEGYNDLMHSLGEPNPLEGGDVRGSSRDSQSSVTTRPGAKGISPTKTHESAI